MPVTYFVGQQVAENSKFDKLLLVKDVVGDVASAINSKASAADVTALTTSIAGKASAASVTALAASSSAALTAAVNGLVGSATALTTLNALKAELVADDAVTNVILTNLSALNSHVSSSVIALDAKDGSSDNYQISVQGDGVNDSLFISKGPVPLMEISSRGAVGETTDVITFSAPVVMNNLVVGGQEILARLPVVYAPCGKIIGGRSSPYKNLLKPVEYFSCIQYAKTPSGALRLMPAVTMPDSVAPIIGTVNPFILNNGQIDSGYHIAPGAWNVFINPGLGGNFKMQTPTDNTNILSMKEQGSVLLDIFRQTDTLATENLPVMFNIHGGALEYSSRNLEQQHVRMLYDDTRIIVVNVEYRQSLLGWTALSEFKAPAASDVRYSVGGVYHGMEQFAGACGNQGLTDVIVALQWVKRNIAAFGGNPNNVTICGDCGGQSIGDLLCISPFSDHSTPAKTLFHKVCGSGQYRGIKEFGFSNNYDFPNTENWKTITSVKPGGGNTMFENYMSPVSGDPSSIGGLGVPKYTTDGTTTDGKSYVSGDYYKGSDLVNYIQKSPTPMVTAAGGEIWNTWDLFMMKSGTTSQIVKDDVTVKYNLSDALENNYFLDVPLLSMCSRQQTSLYEAFYYLGQLGTVLKNDTSSNPNSIAATGYAGDLSFNNNLTPSSLNPGDACLVQMSKGTLLRKNFGNFCRLYGLEGEDLPATEYTWTPLLQSSISLTETFSVFKLYHAAVAKATIVDTVITSVALQSKGYGYTSTEKPVVTIRQMIKTYGSPVSIESLLVTVPSANVTMEVDPDGKGHYRVKEISLTGLSLSGYAKNMIKVTPDYVIRWVEVNVDPPAIYYAAVASATIVDTVITSVTMDKKGYGYKLNEKPVVKISQMKIDESSVSTESKLVTVPPANVTMELEPDGKGHYRVKEISLTGLTLSGYTIVSTTEWVKVNIASPSRKSCPPLAKVLVGQKFTPFDQSKLPADLHLDINWNQNNILNAMLTNIFCVNCLLHTVSTSGRSKPSYSIMFDTWLTGKNQKPDGTLVDPPLQYAIHYLNKLYVGNEWEWSENTASNYMCDFYAGSYGDKFLSGLGYPKMWDSVAGSDVDFLSAPYIPSAADMAAGAKLRQIYKAFMNDSDLSAIVPASSTHNALRIGLNADATASDIGIVTINSISDGMCVKIFNMCFNTTVNTAIDWMTASSTNKLSHFLI